MTVPLLIAAGVCILLVGVWMVVAALSRPTRRPWSDRTTNRLARAVLGWTIVTGVVLALAPVGVSHSASEANGEVTTTVAHPSLLEHEGPRILLVLLIPVAVALLGALGHGRSARRLRLGGGVLLAAFCIVGTLSIGWFYVPAAIMLIAAGVKASRAAAGTGTTARRTGF